MANQDYYNWLQNVYNPTYQSQVQNQLLPYQGAVGQYGAGVNQWLNLLNAFNQSQGNQFSRLSGLAGAGQNAAVNQGTFGQNFGSQAGSNIIGAGNAGAGGVIGASNALTGGITSGINSLLAPNMGANSGLGNALQALLGGGNNNLANNYPFAMNINAAPNTPPVAF